MYIWVKLNLCAPWFQAIIKNIYLKNILEEFIN